MAAPPTAHPNFYQQQASSNMYGQNYAQGYQSSNYGNAAAASTPTYGAPVPPPQPAYSQPPLQQQHQPQYQQPQNHQYQQQQNQQLQNQQYQQNQQKMGTQVETQHEDLIHDAQLDYYGRRLATASSDKTVRIFEVMPCAAAGSSEGSNDNQQQQHRLITQLTGHEGPVWQVAWAHPRFGSLLASASYDGSVMIWKDTASSSAHSNSSSWTRVKEFRQGASGFNAVTWAPHQLGLFLACAGSDGRVTVLAYQEASGTWTHSDWAAHQIACNAVSWAPFDDNAASKNDVRLVTGGSDNVCKIWSLKGLLANGEDQSNGEISAELQSELAGHSDWVRDVVWSPNDPRLIVSGSQDRTVSLWTQSSSSSNEWARSLLQPSNTAAAATADGTSTMKDVVWRVSFSPEGQLLAVSCGENLVSLWKRLASGQFEFVSEMDQSSLL